MRTIEPTERIRPSICRFLQANGIDPNRVTRQPFTYDGRRRRLVLTEAIWVDGKLVRDPADRGQFLVVDVAHRVAAGATPRRFGI